MHTHREILDNLDQLTEESTLSAEQRISRIVCDGKWHTVSTVVQATGVGRFHASTILNRLCGERRMVKIGTHWHAAYRDSTVKRWEKADVKEK
jgi:hypothetical protein